MQTLLVTGAALLAAAYLAHRLAAALRVRPAKGDGCGSCGGCPANRNHR